MNNDRRALTDDIGPQRLQLQHRLHELEKKQRKEHLFFEMCDDNSTLVGLLSTLCDVCVDVKELMTEQTALVTQALAVLKNFSGLTVARKRDRMLMTRVTTGGITNVILRSEVAMLANARGDRNDEWLVSFARDDLAFGARLFACVMASRKVDDAIVLQLSSPSKAASDAQQQQQQQQQQQHVDFVVANALAAFLFDANGQLVVRALQLSGLRMSSTRPLLLPTPFMVAVIDGDATHVVRAKRRATQLVALTLCDDDATSPSLFEVRVVARLDTAVRVADGSEQDGIVVDFVAAHMAQLVSVGDVLLLCDFDIVLRFYNNNDNNFVM